MVVLNVYALLNRTMHLQHAIPLAILIGHEMRHALERVYAGDFNFSNPDRNPQLHADGSRESGLGFELDAIGEKYRFPVFSDLAEELVLAIDEGIKAGRIPSVLEADIQRFWPLKDAHSSEMPLDCLCEEGGFGG